LHVYRHSGPNEAAAGPGGEFPNLPAVFSENDTWWKIPKIVLPNVSKRRAPACMK
jgi:hypothetical protein